MKLKITFNRPTLHYIFSLLSKYSTKHPRLVGGCVRDSLINKYSDILTSDIDIATTLTPKETTEILTEHKIKVIPTGIKFGTITAIIDKEKFEITTLRRDIKCDGRHVQVEFTDDYRLDAERRDFTINALSYSLLDEEIYDYFDGLKHLKEQKVIFIGEPHQRIVEDHLRILRFFRFSATYTKQIDAEGYQACCKYRNLLVKLSAERVSWEIDKLLSSSNPTNCLKHMIHGGIMNIILPKLNCNTELLDKTLVLEQILNIKVLLPLRYAAILHINDTQSIFECLSKLKFKIKLVKSIVTFVSFIKEIKHIRESDLKEKLKTNWYYNYQFITQYIIIAAALGYYKDSEIQNTINEFTSSLPKKMPLNGYDLLALGYQSKDLKEQLSKLEKAWLLSNCGLSKHQLFRELENDQKI